MLAVTFLNDATDDERDVSPWCGMESVNFKASLVKSRTVRSDDGEHVLLQAGRRRRGGDTAAKYLLSGADMTADGFVSMLIAEPLRRRFSQEQSSGALDLGPVQSR